jgi:16S rRNA (guanine527-N7)-methyltransferase
MSHNLKPEQEESFDAFVKHEQLGETVAEQFKHYLVSLLEWNEQFNLTAITDVKLVLQYHFQDSLYLRDYLDISQLKGIADVGAGAGFPGIPLKLVYPHLRLVLIEVNNKKVKFLDYLIETLSLKNTEVYRLDWRTFLRKTEEEIDLFCSRASLSPLELIRMFKQGCIYNNAQLVYWASATWQPDKKEEPFVFKEIPYKIGNKKRKFIFFKKK